MTDSGIVIPTEISAIISERTTLWNKMDEAQRQFNEMEKLSSQVASSTSVEIPSALTGVRTPYAEVVAAAQNFRGEMAQISKGQEGINAYQTEIKKIENQQLTIVIVVSLVLALFVCMAACGGIAILNSFSR